MRLPDYRVNLPNVNNFFQPVQQALQGYVQGMDRQTARNDRLEQQQYQRSQDAIQNDMRNEMFKLRKADFERQAKAAEMEAMHGKTVNVGGNLVAVKPDGSTEVLFSAPNQSSPINVDGNLVTQNPDGSLKFLYRKPPSIAERLLQGAPAQQPGAAPVPAQPRGGVIQQSNPVEQPTDPNLQLTAGGAAPQAAPAPAQDMVTLPNGRQLPRAQAEQLRFGLALEGNKAAVDALDAVLNPPGNQIGEAGSNEVDKQLINTGNALSRLQEIQRQFKPEFQVWENRASMAIKDTLDRFGFTRGSIEPETRKQMEDYRKFRLSAIDNINRYIKEITGAQMSEAEATRLRQGAPDAGDSPINPWSGDSPIAFKSKMEQTIRTMGLAKARFTYLKRNGFRGDAEAASAMLPLDQMENVIQERTRQLQQRARAEGVPQQQAAPWIQKNLKQEFGI